jgi:hypothetical protein
LRLVARMLAKLDFVQKCAPYQVNSRRNKGTLD